MGTRTKLEFAVQMTCQSCVNAIEEELKKHEDITSVAIDLAKEQVVLETSQTSHAVQQIIESTCRRAVLMGMGCAAGNGHLGAAVVMLSGETGGQGIIRLVQVSSDVCVVDGTVDGLAPGLHTINVHALGDLSDGCHSCGDVFNLEPIEDGKKYGDLCSVETNEEGRAEFRIETERVKVWDIIGRSMVVHRVVDNTDERVSCGIVARSAGLFQNPKRICACDGVAVWDERDVPLAGPGRQMHSAQL